MYTLILFAIPLALYWHSAAYTYTELDDSIFIREFEQYNRQDSSYARSFQRGVFNDTNDTYYRPLLLNSFVFDRHLESKLGTTLHYENNASDSISRYHWTNIILHLAAVLLLFFLLRMLALSDNTSFVLSLIFAVHPVLTQAVCWIPGRNDSMLAVFTFAFFLTSLSAAQRFRWWLIPLQVLSLFLALLTKETALIAAPFAMFLLFYTAKRSWTDRTLWLMIAAWIVPIGLWWLLRSEATVKNEGLGVGQILATFIERLPVVLQYLGKILLPVNLAVVPYQEQTTIWFGVLALGILVAIVWWTRQRNWILIITGIVWYLVFLLPVLVVPKELNREIYEHRLYIPLIGILLILAQSDLIRRFTEQRVLIVAALLVALLGTQSYLRSDLFANRLNFWESAVSTAPESAYCTMMLGARYLLDKQHPRVSDGEALIRKAYHMDSTEKYVNYYMALVLWNHDQVLDAEPMLQRELKHNPGWAELYFRLARCAIERKDFALGQQYLLRHWELNPHDSQGINNLLMVCVDRKDFASAWDYAQRIQAKGDVVPDPMLTRIREGLRQSRPQGSK